MIYFIYGIGTLLASFITWYLISPKDNKQEKDNDNIYLPNGFIQIDDCSPPIHISKLSGEIDLSIAELPFSDLPYNVDDTECESRFCNSDKYSQFENLHAISQHSKYALYELAKNADFTSVEYNFCYEKWVKEEKIRDKRLRDERIINFFNKFNEEIANSISENTGKLNLVELIELLNDTNKKPDTYILQDLLIRHEINNAYNKRIGFLVTNFNIQSYISKIDNVLSLRDIQTTINRAKEASVNKHLPK